MELDRRDNVIVVPRDAVTRENDTFAVRTLDGSAIRRRTVTLGATNDVESIVTSGLEPGMKVQRHVAQ